MHIREATIEDCPAIYRLNTESLGYSYPEEKTKERLHHILQSPAAKLFVACAGSEVVGYIHAEDYECTFQDSRKNIIALAVAAAQQGKGVGTALISAVENWARETGAAGIRLVSGINRTKAHAFYEARGYTCRKEQKNFVKSLA